MAESLQFGTSRSDVPDCLGLILETAAVDVRPVLCFPTSLMVQIEASDSRWFREGDGHATDPESPELVPWPGACFGNIPGRGRPPVTALTSSFMDRRSDCRRSVFVHGRHTLRNRQRIGGRR